MLKVKSGNVQLLGVLYERYKKWLFNFFVQMNGDRYLSEDLVQNVFMRVLKYKHTYTEESKFVTWVFQIARNAQNDHFRKNQKFNEQVSVDELAYRLDGNKGQEEVIEREEEHSLLHHAIQRLPKDKREVIVLSKLKELRYREVAEILDCSEEAARTKAHRALKELKIIYFELQEN